MSKADLIEEAEGLGIELSGDETVADLEKLIKKAEKATVDTDVELPDVKVTSKRSGSSSEIDIVRKGEYVRTYSLKTHGEGFEGLARQFCDKNNAEGVAGGTIKALEVFYRTFNRDLNIYAERTELLTSEDPAFRDRALELKSKYNGTIFVRF